jgi:hypothetical protein
VFRQKFGHVFSQPFRLAKLYAEAHLARQARQKVCERPRICLRHLKLRRQLHEHRRQALSQQARVVAKFFERFEAG